MKTHQLILAGLLLASLFASQAKARNIADAAAIELNSHATPAPSAQHRYWRRRWWHHYNPPECPPVAPTPEPATLTLLGLGGMGLAYGSRRKKRQQALHRSR